MELSLHGTISSCSALVHVRIGRMLGKADCCVVARSSLRGRIATIDTSTTTMMDAEREMTGDL